MLTIEPTDYAEAKKAVEREKKALDEQKAKWPRVKDVARALSDLLEENHFSERIKDSWGGNHEPR